MPSDQIVVFTNGVFDLLYPGHIRLLKWAKSFGDYLIVGLNSDSSVKRLKGNSRPIMPENDRFEILSSIKYVDKVIIFSEDTPYELIKRIRPNIIVKGGDYTKETVVGRDLVDRVFIVKYDAHFSTTKLIESLKAA